MKAFSIIEKKPKVNKLIGKKTKFKTGLIILFNNIRVSVAKRYVKKLCSILKPGITKEVAYNETKYINKFLIKALIILDQC